MAPRRPATTPPKPRPGSRSATPSSPSSPAAAAPPPSRSKPPGHRLACAQAGLERAPLGADVEEALATLAKAPAPLDAIVPFLRSLAAGSVPEVPSSLPREVAEVLGQVLGAVREARAR